MSTTGTKFVFCDETHTNFLSIRNLSEISLNHLWNIVNLDLQKPKSRDTIFEFINSAINNFYQFNNDLKDVDFSTLSIETLQLDLTTPKINLENVDNIYEEFRAYKIHQIIDKKLSSSDVVFLDLTEIVMIRKLSEEQNNSEQPYNSSTTTTIPAPLHSAPTTIINTIYPFIPGSGSITQGNPYNAIRSTLPDDIQLTVDTSEDSNKIVKNHDYYSELIHRKIQSYNQ